MGGSLPLLDAQLAFGLDAERSGYRPTVTVNLRAAPGVLSTGAVRQVVESVLLRNPALCHRIRFARGEAFQQWFAPELDFAEVSTTAAGVAEAARTAVERFEADLDGPALATRLIRTPASDQLLLVLDHGLIDEHSVQLVRRQLSVAASPDGTEAARYQAAVHDRKASERAAAVGAGLRFWSRRLAEVGEFPGPTGTTARAVPVARFPVLRLPDSFRGSLFPYVLFSLHRALREFMPDTPVVVGYPWGGRNAVYRDVVGCFMNTVISLEPACGLPPTLQDFLGGWYREIDHADVPLSAVAGLTSGFTGHVTAYLSYSHAERQPVAVAGVPTVEVRPSHSRPPPASLFLASVVVRGAEVELGLVSHEQTAGFGAGQFGSCWREQLAATISNAVGAGTPSK